MLIFDDFFVRRAFEPPGEFFCCSPTEFFCQPFFFVRLHLGSAGFSVPTSISVFAATRATYSRNFFRLSSIFLAAPLCLWPPFLLPVGNLVRLAFVQRVRLVGEIFKPVKLFKAAPLCLFPHVLLSSESDSVQEGRLLCQGVQQVKRLFASSTKEPLFKYKPLYLRRNFSGLFHKPCVLLFTSADRKALSKEAFQIHCGVGGINPLAFNIKAALGNLTPGLAL